MTGIAAGAAALIGVALGRWGVVIFALLTVAMLAIRPSRPRSGLCAVALAAVVLGAWRAETVRPLTQIDRDVQGVPSAIVVTAPDVTGQRQSFAVELPSEPGMPANGLSARVCVTSGPVPVVRLGDIVQALGEVEYPEDQPMGRRAAMSARGCMASVYATSIRILGSSPSMLRGLADLRTQLGAALRQAAPGDAGVLLSGLVTGDDEGFSRQRRDAFIRTGTTHLTAVSGSKSRSRRRHPCDDRKCHHWPPPRALAVGNDPRRLGVCTRLWSSPAGRKSRDSRNRCRPGLQRGQTTGLCDVDCAGGWRNGG